ncbi:MAG: T9SS type A sorting domain-containing protein, partial [Flavobacteriales bacterium]|nr:T9SS type A sorting domain-containing protein [Flavobacteriales bacterium]
GQCGYNLAIPNNGCGSSNFLNALVTISGQNDQLNTNVALESVDLIITHPNRADIDMVLISPTGQSRNLMLDRGGSGDNFGNNGNCPTAVFKLRDGGTALNTIGNTPNSVTGTYAPEQALAGFTGNPNGTWTVRICDDASWNAGNLRYVRLNFQVIDCLGVPGGSALPGTPCNDGNACTINDTYTVDCQCVGTFQDTDNDGVCNANDGCPNDPAKIAPGVCGCGTPDVPVTYYADSDGDGVGDPLVSQPGYTCNVPPGYVTTTGDGCPTDANKTHPGVCGCGTPDTDTDEDGTADCIDGCPNDPDKTAPGVCGCGTADIAVTYYADADGDGAGDPLVSQPGYTCNVPPGYVTNADDGCPGDANKTAPGVCGCGNLDTDTDNDGTPDCDDDCPADPDKTSPGECGCGVPDTDTDDDGVADCNDGCPTDPDKTAPGACGCGNPDTDSDGDGVLDCNDSCPNLFGGVGSPCNDNNSGTVLDQITPGCQCQGVPCTEQVNLAIDLDMHGSQISWEIAQSGTGIVICSGGLEIPYPDNTPFPLVESCCLPAGCYSLTVFDSAGDGITGGGYQLRETGANGRRIIDNTGGFTTGFQSSLAGDQDFCVPIGDDRLIFSSCDKLDWVANKYVVAVANPAVSATWVQGGPNSAQPTNSGYEFWIFDPNGGYSFRRFRSHSVSDGFSPANAYRACHMKLNGWMDSHITPHVPEGTLMNVKVRGRVNGVNLPFGHACKLKLDAVLATCPRVKLQDDPSNPDDYSCGVFRSFGGGSNPANRITANPPQPVPVVASNNVRYQFRFRIQGEGVCIVRPPQTSARMQLNWNATSGAPLVCNKTYDVDVRVSLDGGATWCFGPAGSGQAAACADSDAWGKVCKVTINGCSQANGGGSNMAQNADGTSPHQRVLLYPNPNRGEQLFISLPSPSGAAEAARTVSVDIFDMTGKRVAARTLTVQHGMVNSTMDLSGDLPGGVYLVNITTDDKTYTERLVIQR